MPHTEEDPIAERQRETITTMQITTVKDLMDLMEVNSISTIRRVHDQGLMTALVTPTLKVDLDGRPDLSDPISSMPGPSRPQALGHGNMSMLQVTTRMRTGVLQCTVDHIS